MNPADDIIEDLTLIAPPDFRWLAWVAVALLLMAVLAWILRSLRRSGYVRWLQKTPISLETSALDELAAIRSLVEAGRVREFADRISDILRRYLEKRFGLHAPQLSTEEFLHEARRNADLTPDQRSGLGDFLFECDSVKFALGDLAVGHMNALYDVAERFFRESKPANRDKSVPAAS